MPRYCWKHVKFYTKQLDKIFAAPEGVFQSSEFSILPDEIDMSDKEFNDRITSPQKHLFTFSSKREEDGILSVNFSIDKNPEKELDIAIAKKYFNAAAANATFSHTFPRPFISSAERTGVTIFRKELNFARDRLLKEMAGVDSDIDPRQLLSKGYQRYPPPIEADVDFMGQLQDVAKNKSFIAKEHPEILDDFTDIVGGAYVITSNDQLYYIPQRHAFKTDDG